MEPGSSEITLLLARLSDGDASAASRLMPLVYGELRQIAARYMKRERPEHTLQATALVHEAYMRLVDQRATKDWKNRAHFFGFAAQLMQHILLRQLQRSAVCATRLNEATVIGL